MGVEDYFTKAAIYLLYEDDVIINIGANPTSNFITDIYDEIGLKIISIDPFPIDKLKDLDGIKTTLISEGVSDSKLSLIAKDVMGQAYDGRKETYHGYITLDSFYEFEPSLIKIDCAGIESNVINSGNKIINKYMPYLLIDFYPGNKKQVIDYMRGKGYKTIFHCQRKQFLTPEDDINENGHSHLIFINKDWSIKDKLEFLFSIIPY